MISKTHFGLPKDFSRVTLLNITIISVLSPTMTQKSITWPKHSLIILSLLATIVIWWVMFKELVCTWQILLSTPRVVIFNNYSGNYDETDMGTDGQSMFMVAYSGKKQLGQVFLDLLGIKIEWSHSLHGK